MSTTYAGLTLASYRGGSTYAPLYETFVIVPLIVVLAFGCVLIFKHLERRDRRPKRVADQWQASAVMSELCPHGWQAQITLRGSGAPAPGDAADARGGPVELEWRQFDDRDARELIARRVWASTIPEALQRMVDDRQIDITLERAEQAAARDGDLWGGE